LHSSRATERRRYSAFVASTAHPVIMRMRGDPLPAYYGDHDTEKRQELMEPLVDGFFCP
jgi:hypothetical protein